MNTNEKANPESSASSEVSRRSMLAATGGAVVAGVVASPSAVYGNQEELSEIEAWTNLIGQSFRCTALAGEQGNEKLELISVDRYTAKNLGRPKNSRIPFSLVFKNPVSRTPFSATRYVISHRKTGRNTLFLCEAMDMKSGQLVVEAVFG